MKLNSIIYILIALIFCTACEDFLDQKPITETTSEDVFSSASAISLLVLGAYEPMRWEFNPQFGDSYSMVYLYTDVRSDDVVIENKYNQPHSHDFQIFSDMTSVNTNLEGIWSKFFTGVSRSNKVILGVKESKEGILTEDVKKLYIAEAQFLRAYYYFELVKNFGDVPLFDETPVDVSAVGTDRLQRKPVNEVYAQIEEDLKEAANVLPTSQTQKHKATKGAALGLLAKVFLYQKKWQDAADAAKAVIDLGIYSLEDNYADNFKLDNEFGDESIFEINYTNDPSGGAFSRDAKGSLTAQFFSPYISFPVHGWSYNVVTKDLLNSFDAENDLVRKDATVIEDGTYIESQAIKDKNLYPFPEGWSADKIPPALYGDGFVYSRKYYLTHEEVTEKAASFSLSPLNHKVLRYAEILLIHAEAVAMGATGNGQSSFDKVRKRVGLETKELTLEAIKIERRLELATEWNRFHDLVRWGDAENELEGFTVGRDEVLPIPFNEIHMAGKDKNGNNILTQNPGYK